jgi:hypothetical protein
MDVGYHCIHLANPSASMWIPLVKHFFADFANSYFISSNSLAETFSWREWAFV